MIEEAAAIEDDLRHAGGLGRGGNALADFLRRRDGRAGLAATSFSSVEAEAIVRPCASSITWA